MLDISLPELTGRAEKEVLAHEVRLRVDQRHHVLQLVTEAEGASWLVVTAPRPNAASQSLVQEPPVRQDVEGWVGRFNMYCAKSVLPVLPHRFERVTGGGRSPEAMHQVDGFIAVSPYAEREDDLTLLPVGQLEWNLASLQGADMDDLPWPHRLDRPEQFLLHGSVMRHLVLWRMDHDHTEPKLAEILLELQSAVDGHQDIELLLSQPQKRPVLERVPALLVNCRGLMVAKELLHPGIYAFINEDAHSTIW